MSDILKKGTIQLNQPSGRAGVGTLDIGCFVSMRAQILSLQQGEEVEGREPYSGARRAAMVRGA